MSEKIREKFGAEELAVCLSHFDLGIIYSIQEFARGSRRAPKTVLDCERGKFLFKRRQKGKEDIHKVAFTHQIQLSLAAQNFPLPHLLGTREENNSMLVLNDRIYEMQEYISGTGYDGSALATEQAGHALGLYHKLLEGFQSDYDPPTASYHNAKAIHQAIIRSASALKEQIRQEGEGVLDDVRFLEKTYRYCAESVNKLGLKEWPPQIVHGDWHPGNMLFRDQLIVAVIDYDTARLQQRVIDFANGALQFSILGGGKDPTTWPVQIDVDRYSRFLNGYDSVNVIATDELRAVPYLMCEAMIAEAVLPIAATGTFGRFDGVKFLKMIRRKVQWILDKIDLLTNVLGEPPEGSSGGIIAEELDDEVELLEDEE